MAPSSIGSANLALTDSNAASSPRVSATPSSTACATVCPGASRGSCGRYPTVIPWAGPASPTNSASSPAMMRRRVDLPEPFSPSTPIFAPGRNESQMSSSTFRFCP